MGGYRWLADRLRWALFTYNAPMKSLTLALICLTCVTGSAQNEADTRVHFGCVPIPLRFLICHTTLGNDNVRQVAEDRRYTSGADFARAAKVGDTWWPVGNGKIIVTMAASDIKHGPANTYELTGGAEIHTTAIDVLSDDAVYHADTGEIETRGIRG